jgi:hypothetical protein
VDHAGNLFIADSGNRRIRRVSKDGIIATVAGTESDGFSGDGGPATDARLSAPPLRFWTTPADFTLRITTIPAFEKYL